MQKELNDKTSDLYLFSYEKDKNYDFINSNINIQEIARRLGHAKIDMTWNTYCHLYPGEEEKAVKILDNLF